MTSSRRAGEQGSVTAFAALAMTALFALVGLVVDGGTALSARQAAADEAEQAARAGAAALSVDALRAGATMLDAAQAVSRAVAYTVSAGHPGTASVVDGVVEVTVRYQVRTAVLGLIGIATFSVVGSATAVDVAGVTRED